jgi:hypothetical protein
VAREHPAPLAGKRRERRRLGREQMTKEAGRPPHGLARVVQDVVEPRQPFREKPREQLDARCVPQIEAEDLQPLAKLREIRLLRVAARGVDGKARRDDDVRAGTQQFQRRLIADLYARAGDDGVMAREIGSLLALRVVEVPARLAERVVVAVQLRERLLADVARKLALQLGTLVQALGSRRLEPQRRINRRAALNAHERRVDEPPIVRFRGFALGAPEGFRHSHEIVALGFGDEAGERQQLAALLARQAGQVGAIGFDRAQHAHARLDVVVGELGRRRRIGRFHGGMGLDREV